MILRKLNPWRVVLPLSGQKPGSCWIDCGKEVRHLRSYQERSPLADLLPMFRTEGHHGYRLESVAPYCDWRFTFSFPHSKFPTWTFSRLSCCSRRHVEAVRRLCFDSAIRDSMICSRCIDDERLPSIARLRGFRCLPTERKLGAICGFHWPIFSGEKTQTH